MPMEELTASLKLQIPNIVGVELVLFATWLWLWDDQPEKTTDLIQSAILASCPQSQAQNGRQEVEIGHGLCFCIFLARLPSSRSPSPARCLAPFLLRKRKLMSPGGQVPLTPASQKCVITNYIKWEDIQLRQEFLARNRHSLKLTCTEKLRQSAHWWMDVARLFWVLIVHATYSLEWLGSVSIKWTYRLIGLNQLDTESNQKLIFIVIAENSS